MTKRIVSLLLIFTMCFSLMPAVAWADADPLEPYIGYWVDNANNAVMNMTAPLDDPQGCKGNVRFLGGNDTSTMKVEYADDEFTYSFGGKVCDADIADGIMTVTQSAIATPAVFNFSKADISLDAAGIVVPQDFIVVKNDDGAWTLTIDNSTPLKNGETWAFFALPGIMLDEKPEIVQYLFAQMNGCMGTSTSLRNNSNGMEELIKAFEEITEYFSLAQSVSGLSATNVISLPDLEELGGLVAVFAAKTTSTESLLVDINGNLNMLLTVGGAVIPEGADEAVNVMTDDTCTITFDMNGYGIQIPDLTGIELGDYADGPEEPVDSGALFRGWVDELGNPWYFEDYPVTRNMTLKALWLEPLTTISLTWLDSKGKPIPGAPTSYAVDMTGVISSYVGGGYASEEAAYAASASMCEDLKEILYYGYYPYWDMQWGRSNTMTYEYPDYICRTIIRSVIQDFSEESSYTLKRSSGYDIVEMKLYDEEWAEFTFSGWADKYDDYYADLLTVIEEDTEGTYLPALIYDEYNGKDIKLAGTVAELKQFLDDLAEYCVEFYSPDISIGKCEDKSISLTWLDTADEALGDPKIYQETYTMPLLDYYASKNYADKTSAKAAAKQDFLNKLGTAFSWDNGYGAWDLYANNKLYNKLTADEVFDFLFEDIHNISSASLRQHKDEFTIDWDEAYEAYTLSEFYVEEDSELDLEAWQETYEGDLKKQIDGAFANDTKLYVEYSLYDANDTITETGYIRTADELTEMLNGLPERCREEGVYYVELTTYTPNTITLSWYDKNGNEIEGLPAEYELDLSLGAAGCGEAFYEEYGDILRKYAQFANLIDEDELDGEVPSEYDYDDPWTMAVTNAQDVMAFAATEVDCKNTTSFSFYEYNGGYTFKGEVAYKITTGGYYSDSVDMWGYYNYHWLTTTYSNGGYHLSSSGLIGADVKTKVTVANGKNLVLGYTVTAPADQAISGGKLGIWTDIMVGDNDGATITTIFDDAGNKVGFDLIDDGWHYGSFRECYAYNAKYSCFVAGENVANAASKILKISNPVEGKFWYGYYGDADDCCFEELSASNANGGYNDDYTALYNTDSGAAASWDVNLAAGESQTYCVVFGIVDATMNVAPRFIGNAPQLGEQGYVTVDVANLVADGSEGHYILLSLDTTDGEQLDAGRAYLYSKASKLFTVDPDTGVKNYAISVITELFGEGDEYQKGDQVAQFIVSEVNAFPDTYVITGMTATNDGGEFAEYVLKDEGYENFTMVIPATPRKAPLSLSNLEVLENLREGWSYDPDTQELTVHGLEIEAEEGPALELPAGTEIVLETFESVTETEEEPGEEPEEEPVAVNRISAQEGAAIMVTPGEEPAKISGQGTLVVDAPTGIDATGGDFTISGGDVVINASELGVACETLTVENEGSLTINLPEGSEGEFLDISALVIPADYEIIGGKLDENGNFVPDEGATQLIIRKKAPVHRADPTINVPISSEEGSVNVKATVSGNTATVQPINEEEIQKVIGDDVETGTVVVDLSSTNKTITGVKLPTETVQAIAEAAAEAGNDTAGLKLELSSGTLEFDAKALETITEAAGDAKNIEIHFDNVGTTRLNADQKAAVSELVVVEGFEAYVTVNGTRVSDFDGGSVVVYIPYEIPEGNNPAGYTVWFVAEDGTMEKQNAIYDGINHRFVVSHFSDYVLTYDETVGQFSNCLKDETCPMSKFTDVDMKAWYHDGVHYCLDNNIMAGFPGDLFKPNGTTTRAQIAQILYNLEGQPAFMNDNIFSDVASGSWYEKAVVWAQGKGVVAGYPDGTFKPDDSITREQLAVILYNYAKYKEIDVAVDENTNFLSFNDFWDTSEWAKSAMMWAVDRELIVGSDMNLKPQGDAVRAQAATILMKYCETVAK